MSFFFYYIIIFIILIFFNPLSFSELINKAPNICLKSHSTALIPSIVLPPLNLFSTFLVSKCDIITCLCQMI